MWSDSCFRNQITKVRYIANTNNKTRVGNYSEVKAVVISIPLEKHFTLFQTKIYAILQWTAEIKSAHCCQTNKIWIRHWYDTNNDKNHIKMSEAVRRTTTSWCNKTSAPRTCRRFDVRIRHWPSNYEGRQKGSLPGPCFKRCHGASSVLELRNNKNELARC